MKYANNPFWVCLRWIFFILFWAGCLGMLVGAIWIIVAAPKCVAPEPLSWYMQGPFAKFKSYEAAVPDDFLHVDNVYAREAIYELPAEQTYAINEPEIQERIKRLVDQYKKSEMLYWILHPIM